MPPVPESKVNPIAIQSESKIPQGKYDTIKRRGELLDAQVKRDEQKNNDAVNHPSHYTDGKIEVIDYIEDKKLNYHLGNSVKYISRAGKKDPSKKIEDLKKAQWYLNREIERLEKEKKSSE